MDDNVGTSDSCCRAEVNMSEWLASVLPDLNPIEYVWDCLRLYEAFGGGSHHFDPWFSGGTTPEASLFLPPHQRGHFKQCGFKLISVWAEFYSLHWRKSL
ncbi:hypothetical protein TNCV_403581 [Trichonephila clavipes]|nr:hypothetical protein TNCV_403581 [Trichonephila clavipes]